MPTPKPKPLTGAAAIKELQRQVSPAGVKLAELKARAATDKKYGNKSTYITTKLEKAKMDKLSSDILKKFGFGK